MANTNKKPTIVENFKDIITVLEENGLLTEDRKAFLEKRIEVTEKKNASKGGEKKLTPTQIANIGLGNAVYDYLKANGKKMSISEMIKEIPACADLNTSKVNGVIMNLYDREKKPNPNPMLVRSEEKGVAKFSANPDYVAEVEGE
jgi:hypothetical protein